MDLVGYWYYHLPNYVLAALIYTLLGRFVLSLFVPEAWPNYIWRAFRVLTDPIVAGARIVTPAIIPAIWLPLIGLVWLVVIRVAFTLFMAAQGLIAPLALL